MQKRLVSFCLFVLSLVVIPGSVWGGGKKEFGGQEAQGLENWSSRIDLADKKPGEYNLIIEAKDHAGNTTIAGPFNIYIDPDSDVPVVSITNPVEGMRVGTNLNIVGIAVDDDSVKKVEISLDGASPVPAEGTDYWSYYLKVADVPDGRHTLTVTAYDVKDIPSKPVSVSFNLDKFKPVNTVSSHENGVLVSGQISVAGSVMDANGVVKLELSDDGGKNYSQVNITESKTQNTVDFSIPIDTRRLTDGPHVYWLRSTDKTSSVGVSAFLLNVDNTAPKISVLSPAADQSVNGRVAIAGVVSDQVGIKTLSWEFGKEKGDFELIPGNPFFFKVFDLSKETGNSTQVLLRSTDRSGNTSELRYPIKIDLNADLPVLTLSEPSDKSVVDSRFNVSGSISDDDSVAKIHYQADGGKEVAIDAKEAFSFELADLAPGAHKISFWAEDGNGAQGKKVERSITVRAAPPVIQMLTAALGRSPVGIAGKVPAGIDGAVSDAKTSASGIPFLPGILVLADGKNNLSGTVTSGNAIKTAEITIGDIAAKALSLKNGSNAAEKLFDIQLPPDIAFGVVPIVLKVKDSFDQEAVSRSFVFVLNYGKVNEEPAVVIGDSRLSDDGTIRLAAGKVLVAALVGAEAKSVALVPPSSLVSAELDGQRIIVRATGQGAKFVSKIVVKTAKGHEVASSDLSFITDFDGPKIDIVKPTASTWIGQDKFTVEGTLSDSTPIASVEYSLDGGKSFQALDLTAVLKAGSASRALSASVSLASQPVGPFVFVLKASDDSGNLSQYSTILQYDNQLPEVSIAFPPELARVAAQVPIIVKTNEKFPVKTLQYRLGEGAWQTLDAGPVVLFTIAAPASDPVKLTVQAIDAAGNVGSAERDIQPAPEPQPVPSPVADPKTGKLPEPAKPDAELLYPGPGDKLGGQAKILLKFNNLSDAYTKISVQAEGGKAEQITLGAGSPYLIQNLDLRSARNASVGLTVLFEGPQNRRQTVNLKLPVDLAIDKPVVSLVQSGADAIPGTGSGTADQNKQGPRVAKAQFAMFATDRVKVVELHYSVDGGADTSLPSDGTALVRLDSLPPGPHKIDYWAVNGSGIAGLKQTQNFTLSGSAPVMQIDSLVKGKSTTAFADMQTLVLADDTRLSGQINLGNALASLEYKLNAGESKKLSPNIKGAGGSFEIPLGKDVPWGRNTISVKASDQMGLASEYRLTFFRVAETAKNTKDESGVYIDLPSENGYFHLAPGDAVTATLVGRPIAKVELNPPSALVSLDFSGSSIRIKALTEGIGPVLKIVATDVDGDVYRSPDLRFLIDAKAPVIGLEGPSDAAWVQNEVVLKGSVSEALGLKSLSYRVSPSGELTALPFSRALPSVSPSPTPAAIASPSPSPSTAARSPTAAAPSRAPSPSPSPSPSPVPSPSPAAFMFSIADITPAEQTYSFDKTVDLSQLPEGAIAIDIVSEDQSGNISTKHVSVSRDVTPPSLAQITPPNETEINGKIIVTGSITDAGRVVSVEFSDNSKDWTPVLLDGLLSFQLDFSAYKQLPESFFLRGTDAAGNVRVFNPNFNVNQKLDLPVVEIQTPLENEVQRSDFRLSGVAYDDDAVKAIYYRVDYKQPAPSPSPSAVPSPNPSTRPSSAPATGRPGSAAPALSPSPSPAVSPSATPGPNVSPSPKPDEAAAQPIDLSTFIKVESTGNVSIPFTIMEIGDNEHVVEVVAEDVNGVLGEVQRRTFRVSTAEPNSLMLSPETSSTERGIIKITGNASDNNGIRDVALSFDNGVSFVRAEGTESWSYVLDTRTLKDGTHSVIIKTNDKYDTEGLFSTLITVDNTPPQISLDLPFDGQVASGKLFISGRLNDGIGVAGLKLSIVPADQPVSSRKDELSMDLPTARVLAQEIDISALKPGWYTLRLEARDRADNLNWVSHDFQATEAAIADKIEMIYPVEGAKITGLTTISGKVTARKLPEQIALYVDNQLLTSLPVNKQGYFTMDLGPVALESGRHNIEAHIESSESQAVKSAARSFDYLREGPWVRFESVKNGGFVNKRPIITGQAGWFLPEPAKDDPAHESWEKTKESRNLDKVQISLDNGRTYQDLPFDPQGWRYRLETQNFPDGDIFLLVRALFRDGSMASDHIVLAVDETPPSIQVIKPGEEGRFNEILDIAGIASDNNELAQIKVDLRQGDKAAYEVPSFIQGMYIDAHILGATTWEAGLGLTFFDDNVKLQVGVGQAPVDERIEGLNVHAKLIASILKLPFSFLFGPDFDFLSASVAVGAQFSYFSNNANNEFNDSSKIVAGALAQIEFPKIFIRDWSILRSYALYTEFEVWFIPSDVATPSAPNVIPRLSFGARIGIF